MALTYLKYVNIEYCSYEIISHKFARKPNKIDLHSLTSDGLREHICHTLSPTLTYIIMNVNKNINFINQSKLIEITNWYSTYPL